MKFERTRCERYIKEFNEDAVKVYKPDAPWVESCGLGIHGEYVRLFMTLTLPDQSLLEVMVSDAPIFFWEYADDATCVEDVVEAFQMNEEEAKERLRKAGLVYLPLPIK